MIRPALGVLPLSLLVSGCLTSGGNIKGDFDCRAPGGTCAPMTSIDAAAVAGIGGVRPMSVPLNGSMGAPLAAPPSNRAGAVRQASVAATEDGTAPPRTSDWVLRVVFPAHIDGDGVYREESAAHAVVENAGWAQAPGVPSYQPRTVPALRGTGVVPVRPGTASAAGANAAPASALATLDEIVAARAAKANGQSAPSAPVSLPSFRATVTVPAPVPAATVPPPSSFAAEPPVAQAMPMALSAFGPSRAAVPTTLAEATAGLAAPAVKSLDPFNPALNYDTPDVVAVRNPAAPATRPSSGKSRHAASKPDGLAPAADENASSPPPFAAQAQTTAAPFGSRPVRWKGRTYDLPYKNPQRASTASAPQSNMTADLNRSSLAKAGAVSGETPADTADRTHGLAATTPATGPVAMAPVVPRLAPTADAQSAAARVRAMAAPILAGAADSGRAEARAAAPQGFSLPLPLSPAVPK